MEDGNVKSNPFWF